ncbi:peptidoglycan/LPS O-acetylase OafA/YrhL [Arcicella aurantiaca]|uniref:Peptidoglycan/LPS O-acetylase OafA/YrhL n=1 Tax=Arcicella aurantiaca TaxID=591202 RepID=A0A316DK15_9BACT|nr:acyltransferase [Arcicella aurantiaca]PWK17013.1 peptidoglycan/LPS O-acetylase OafA/YrhL [Arcicella aurantiaca]
MQNPHQPVYFPNLNGVRFIAAFSVLIHHTEQIKYLMGFENNYGNFFIKNMGKLGVGLFFVLSGFLITYLLFSEKKRRGDISAKDFYIRRILRIWPLYFIIVLLGFFVFPAIPIFNEPLRDQYYFDADFFKRLPFFLLFLPNIGFVFYRSPYLCAQTWSVGVEEQFYAIWPWIIKSKNPLKTFIKLLVGFLTILGLIWLYIFKISDFTEETKFKIQEGLALFFSQFRILTMMIGGIGAYLVFTKKEKILSILFRKDVQIIVYAILALMLGTGFHVPGFNMEFYGFFFCFFILNVSQNPNSIIYLEQKIIHYLGKISYGIYIYHPAVIVLCINTIHYFFGDGINHQLFNFILYPTAILLTIMVCEISFRYIETPLLKLKDRFNR